MDLGRKCTAMRLGNIVARSDSQPYAGAAVSGRRAGLGAGAMAHQGLHVRNGGCLSSQGRISGHVQPWKIYGEKTWMEQYGEEVERR